MGKLTDLDVRNWIKADERFEGRSDGDGDGDGLYLRYRKEDAVPRWLFRYRLASKARVLNLGSYRDLSLANARKTAKEMRARVALGYDVQNEKKQRKADAVAKIEAATSVITVATLADEYFAAGILGRWKHPNIVRSRIERDIKPHIGKLAVGDVGPKHIDAMLKSIMARGAPTMATDVMRWTKRMFDYAVKREIVQYNPASAFDPSDAGGKEESRTRWLSRKGRAQPVPSFSAISAMTWGVCGLSLPDCTSGRCRGQGLSGWKTNGQCRCRAGIALRRARLRYGFGVPWTACLRKSSDVHSFESYLSTADRCRVVR